MSIIRASTPPIWGGGSGDLGTHWIVGYDYDSKTGKIVDYVYGSFTYMGSFETGFGPLVLNGDGILSGSLLESHPTGSISFNNGASYDLTGSLTVPFIHLRSGVLSVDGGTVAANTIDFPGMGLIRVTNHGSVTGDIRIDQASTVEVTGFGSLITGSVRIDGDGLLHISGGAQVIGPADSIGQFSTGMALVDGAGSSWHMDGTLELGSSLGASGALVISNGGVVTNAGTQTSGQVVLPAGNGWIGSNNDSLVTVTGTGSLWDLNGEITVGVSSFGTLAIADSGTVSAETGLVGIYFNNGLVTVDGAGSSFLLMNNLWIGGGASATNGGLIWAGEKVALFSGSTLTVDEDSAVEVGARGGITPGYITVDSGSILTGAGTIVGSLINSGTTSAEGGALILNGSATNIGELTTGAGGVFAITGDVVIGDAGAASTNSYGDPNGTSGLWSYNGAGLGSMTASDGGYISVGNSLQLQSLTLDTVTTKSGGSIEVGGNNGLTADTLTIDAVGLVIGHGTISADTISNGGIIEAKDGTLLILGDVMGNGIAKVDNNSVLEIDGKFTGHVSFNGGYESTLKLDRPDPSDFTGVIGNLVVGDTIDLPKDKLPAGVAHTKINGSTLDVTFSNGAVWSYSLSGNYAGDTLAIRETGDQVDANGEHNTTDVNLTLQAASPKIITDLDGAPTGNPYIDSLVWGWSAWDQTVGPITYWFGSQSDVKAATLAHGETQLLNYHSSVDTWTALEQSAFRQSLQDFASVSGLTFAQAGSATMADIVWWLDPDLPAVEGAGTLGLSEVPAKVSGGSIWQYFDATPWRSNPYQLWFGGDGANTITHEIGHTLGLAHPHDGGSEPDATQFPGVPKYASGTTGVDGQNQGIYSVMSYNQGWDGVGTPPLDYGTQGGLGAFDIAALQQLYSANMTWHTGNDTYTLPCMNVPGTGWSCIWDAGGINMISNAGSTIGCTIDLRAAPLVGPNAGGYASYVDAILGGFTIANGTEINEAVGGSGDDTIYTNEFADTISGGGGNDTVVFSGTLADYTLDRVGAVVQVTALDQFGTAKQMVAPSIIYTLNDITTLQFADASVAADSIACFAAGTRILTEHGEVSVDDLREGMRAVVNDGSFHPVVWIGHRSIDCRRHPNPQQIWPVRIKRDAFGGNLPRRDLIVSPDHCIFVDSVLVMARQLLNGASIFQDTSFDSVTYFHVELGSHAILLAEGLPAESYLDTGNRGAFESVGAQITLHPDFSGTVRTKSREHDTCAPLAISAEEIEPIWQRLAARALKLGYHPSYQATTADPHLRLSVAGRELKPTKATGDRFVFIIPLNAGSVWLTSRAAAPSDLRPWLDDRRRLGVPVKRIMVGNGSHLMEIPPDHPSLVQGWHHFESDGERLWRWTDGNAELPIPPDTNTIEIHLTGSTEYPIEVVSGTPALAA